MLPPMRRDPPANHTDQRRCWPDHAIEHVREILAEPASSWAEPGRGELAGAGEQGGGDLVADVG
jgi:hypothetical protein